MNVLHVIPYMHPRAGGPPVVVDRVCAQLGLLGCETTIVTTDRFAEGTNENWLAPWLTSHRIRVFPLRRQNNRARSRELNAALPDLVAAADVVHLHTLWNDPVRQAAGICRTTRTPCLVMPHGMLDPFAMQRGLWKKRIYGALVEFPWIRRAEGMIFTHAEEERLARQTVDGLPRGFVAPLGADVPPDDREVLAEEFFERFPQLAGRPLVLFLSRLHEKKGLDLLIPAFQQVRAQLPESHLVIVGGGAAAYEAQLRHWVRERHLESAVTFTGTLSGRDKWIAIAAADLFVLPSYQENFALVVADALALGVPVVVSERVNIHDDIAAAGAGVVCDLSVDDIAEKIVAALGNPESLARAGEAGIRLVAEKFTWRGCAGQMLQAYHDVLQQQVRK